jgi:hypothetical protein
MKPGKDFETLRYERRPWSRRRDAKGEACS